MSAVRRALSRLAAPDAVLFVLAGGGFGVFPKGDRRRRPLARLSASEARALEADGTIAVRADGALVLTEPGRALLRRNSASDPDERYLHQHRPVIARALTDDDGDDYQVRGVESAGALKRLIALRNADGAPWLSADEVRAATRLHDDWMLGQAGLIGGSDWSAPPRSGAARGPGNAREGALAAHCDARARVADALDALAAPLRRVVERVCLHEEGLEALERAECWPARSGKIALKLGLAQLALIRPR